MAYSGHVHIATEDLETLHAGATGLCFIIKVWLVTLIGLTSSLNTSNFSEMIQNVHVFLVKGVNSLMSSHLGSPMKNIGSFDSNFLSRMYVQQIKNGALTHTVPSLSLLIIYSLILLAIRYSKHPIDESNHQTSQIVDKHNLGTDITTCSHFD